jgi:hypothetical protein
MEAFKMTSGVDSHVLVRVGGGEGEEEETRASV